MKPQQTKLPYPTKFNIYAKQKGFASPHALAVHVNANPKMHPAHIVQMANFASTKGLHKSMPATNKLMGGF
jgi:hypothetical protein